MKENDPGTISQKFVSEVLTSSFKFVIEYAEKLNGETVEFLNTHHAYEIYYVLENRILSYVEGVVLTLKKGDIIFLAPDVQHYTVYEPGVEKQYFALLYSVIPNSGLARMAAEYGDRYREIRERLDAIDANRCLVFRQIPSLTGILDSIYTEMTNQGAGWSSLVNFSYYEFFIQAIRHIEPKRSSVREPSSNLNLGLEASKYIHENYRNTITLESVGEYLGITPRHVNRVFRKLFGTTFSKTLSLLRLNYAKKYLVSTDYSTDKVSELVGFKTPRTLFKLFNQYEGMTVADFRRQLKIGLQVHLPKEMAGTEGGAVPAGWGEGGWVLCRSQRWLQAEDPDSGWLATAEPTSVAVFVLRLRRVVGSRGCGIGRRGRGGHRGDRLGHGDGLHLALENRLENHRLRHGGDDVFVIVRRQRRREAVLIHVHQPVIKNLAPAGQGVVIGRIRGQRFAEPFVPYLLQGGGHMDIAIFRQGGLRQPNDTHQHGSQYERIIGFHGASPISQIPVNESVFFSLPRNAAGTLELYRHRVDLSEYLVFTFCITPTDSEISLRRIGAHTTVLCGWIAGKRKMK